MPPPSKTNFGGHNSLFWHPARTGKCSGAISINAVAYIAVSIDFTTISTNVVVSMMRR
jgi:hypothetical protein